MYGSMGSNGVILIETEGAASNDMETRVSYYGSFGVNWNEKRMPLMGVEDYKHYLADVGMTISSDPQNFYKDFPFMQNPNDPRSTICITIIQIGKMRYIEIALLLIICFV